MAIIHGDRGIYCEQSSPLVSNCIISTNSTGIYCGTGSSPIISNCVICDNTGRGVFCYTPSSGSPYTRYHDPYTRYRPGYTPAYAMYERIWRQMQGTEYYSPGHSLVICCTVMANTGGGVSGDCVIINCLIIDNQAERGAGVYCASPETTIGNCIIAGNIATEKGGGIYGNPKLSNSIIRENQAQGPGGGLYCCYIKPTPTGGNGRPPYDPPYVTWNSTIANCVISDNKAYDGGGIYYAEYTGPKEYVKGERKLVNCTISTNQAKTSGGGLYIGETIHSIGNCLIWDNESGVGGQQIATGAECEADIPIEYSNIKGSAERPDGFTWGAGIIDEAPLFFDPDGLDDYYFNDYWLSPGSPCIDAGNGDVAPETDIDGYARFDDPDTPKDPDSPNPGWGIGANPDYSDIGAHEFAYIGDLDFDAAVDMADYSTFGTYWLDTHCGQCGGADLTGDGNVDWDDLRILGANWLAGAIN